MKLVRKIITFLLILMVMFGGYIIGTWIFTGKPPELMNQFFPANSKTILILGMDNEGLRSDVMMVAFVNGKTGNVDLLSIPRDTRVTIGGKPIKINSAFALGKEPQSIDVVQNLLDIKIDNYVKFSFESFRNTIDILGGVDYNVPQDMKYSDPEQNLKINLKKGQQHLDGDKAEQLVRYRQYLMGDEDRIKVQQDFIKELFKQKLTPAMITKVPQLLKEVSGSVKTDIPQNEWPGLANIARRMNGQSLSTFQTPGEAKRIDGLSYYVVSEPEAKQMIGEIKERLAKTSE